MGNLQRMEGRQLEAVGVNDPEETVYRFLLEHPGLAPAEIARSLGRPSRQVREALTQLERSGLVSRTAGKAARFVPASPEAAIEVLILNRERDLERTRLAARQMEGSFRESQAKVPSPLDIVEVVLGAEAVTQRFGQLIQATRRQILVFDKPPYQTDATSEPNEIELELLARGVANRVVYDTASLNLTGRIKNLRSLAEAGEEQRTLGELPMKLFLSDDRLAFIPLSLDTPGMEGALLVRPSPVLDAITTLFETLWERALPIDLSGSQAAPARERGGPISGNDEELLVLLVAGLKDQAIARQLDVAPRTVIRRVGKLMRSMGAKTRFQAGWMAAKRGLSRQP